ncbi:MAG: GNAT family N-acetyltransferase [Bifidobacteriaceae bacterium]|nr:GNAT family N-acetyltransferase [Bifidobacteriaceae bacterium]
MSHQRILGAQAPAGVRLRRATAADLPRILELEEQIFGEEAWPQDLVAFELAAPNRLYLAAERPAPDPRDRGRGDGSPARPAEGNRMVGYGGIFLGGRDAEVMNLAVDPASRGHGVGRALMEALIRAAQAKGATRIDLTCADGAEPAAALYRSLGFKTTGRIPGYYQPSGRDGILMGRELREGGDGIGQRNGGKPARGGQGS